VFIYQNDLTEKYLNILDIFKCSLNISFWITLCCIYILEIVSASKNAVASSIFFCPLYKKHILFNSTNKLARVMPKITRCQLCFLLLWHFTNFFSKKVAHLHIIVIKSIPSLAIDCVHWDNNDQIFTFKLQSILRNIH
jgi:hypothetical protein